jgi:hypothetical protein
MPAKTVRDFRDHRLSLAKEWNRFKRLAIDSGSVREREQKKPRKGSDRGFAANERQRAMLAARSSKRARSAYRNSAFRNQRTLQILGVTFIISGIRNGVEGGHCQRKF